MAKRKIRALKLSSKVALGGLFLLFFTLDYQPSLNIPPIKKNLALAQNEQIQQVNGQTNPLEFQLPHPGYISTHYSNYHPGIDLAFGLGAPVKAIAKGKVIQTGYNFWGLGLTVTIDHGYGYQSLYAHLGKTYVKEGQEIAMSDYIGEIGLTGNTSGPHTHIEIRKDGKTIDPLAILPQPREYPLAEDFRPVGGSTSQPGIQIAYQPPKAQYHSEPVKKADPVRVEKTIEQKTQDLSNQLGIAANQTDLRKELLGL